MAGTVSMAAVHIAIHESVLDEMKSRAARLHRERLRIIEEIEVLESDIRSKQISINAARDKWLIGGCV